MEFFDTLKKGAGKYIANVLNDSGLGVNSVVKDYLTTEQLSENSG